MATAEQERAVVTPAALDRAAGVELLGDVHGSGYERGAALVRRADGQMVQLGPLMYALLECVDGQSSLEQLSEAMCERLGRGCDVGQVRALAEKLAAQGLLAGSEENAPPRRNPLLALRFKVLVTNPRATRLLTAPFTVLFHPLVLWPMVAAFVAVLWFVLFHKGVASATSQAFDQPGLLLLVFALGVASAGFHELGHAAAARYGGATPGGMGMGIYMVWPAFYTDVTDAYRLPRRDRLRVDLGGIYFNAVIGVVTTGVWLAWHVDGLLLLVALQLLMMVKNLSPMIRSDGYHVLADATGVPDLFAHMGPTLRRLIPGRHEPSALRGRARALVTVWVLVVIPLLFSLMLGAVLLLPRLAASAWDSGRLIVEELPHQSAIGIGASLVRLLALLLPLVGSALIAQKLLRSAILKAHRWSDGHGVRRLVVLAGATAGAAVAAWAWFPAGQYQAVQAADGGTLVGFTHALASPAAVARPVALPSAPRLAPGKYLAVSMIPHGGATKAHPALYVIPGHDGDPPVAIAVAEGSPVADGDTTTPPPVVSANAFQFQLPSKPGPGDSQALAVNHTDGSVVYDIAYSLVTVKGGDPVTSTNSAFAFANCHACATVAVSFQVVLVIGQSNRVAPINAAGALNEECPACVTAALAYQIVVTLKSQPSAELMQRLQASLQKLNAISTLGSLQEINAQVAAVQKEIDDELDQSGLVDKPKPPATTTTPATTTAPTTTAPPATTTNAATTTTAPATTTAPTTTAPPPATTTSPATTTTPAPTTTSESTTTAPTETTPPPTTTTTSTTTSG